MSQAPETLTAVSLSFRKNRVNDRLLFGSPCETIRRGWHQKLAVFQPGSMFGYERWRANSYGTQHWRLIVAKAAQPGGFTHSPGICPGANLWLDARGSTRVKRAFACIDTLRNQYETLESVPEHMWREVHNQLLSGQSDTRILETVAGQIQW